MTANIAIRTACRIRWGGQKRDGVVPFARLHRVSGAGAKMVFIDKERRGSDCFWPLVLDDDRWLWRPWSWPPGLQGLTNRHRNGCNVSFADAHGEWIHWKDDRTRKLIQGRIASQTCMKRTPTLDFRYDEAVETGLRITAMLEAEPELEPGGESVPGFDPETGEPIGEGPGDE